MRRTIWLWLLLAAVGLAGGAYLVARWKVPHLLDTETTNAGEMAALATAPLTATAATGDDWPQYLGPTRDGRANGSLRADWDKSPPAVAWTAPIGGGYAQPAVLGDTVYAFYRVGGDDHLTAFAVADGTKKWDHPWPADYGRIGYGGGPRATPTFDAGRWYLLSANGGLRCVERVGDAINTRWEHDLVKEFDAPPPQWGYASSPLIEGNLCVVQVGGPNGSVVAFDKSTGEKRWAAGTDRNGYSSPVAATFGGVRQIVAVTGESVLGVRADTGAVLWRYEFRTQYDGNIAAPVAVGEFVFVTAAYNKGCALLHVFADRVEPVYFKPNKLMRSHHATPVHKDGFAYGFDNDTLRCVDLRKGAAVDGWEGRDADNRTIPKGSVTLAGDRLLGLTQTGTLFLADADPAEFRFRGKLDKVLDGSECWAAPVLAGGRVFLRDAAKLVCVSVGR